MDHLRVASLWASALMQSFESQGLDPEELAADLPDAARNQSMAGQSIDINSARLIWHKAYNLTKDDILGFNIAKGLNLRSAGVLLPICWHSPTPRKALEHILNFQILISNNGVYRSKVCGDDLLFEYQPAASSIPACDQQILSVIIGTYGTIRMITDGKVVPKLLLVPKSLKTERLQDEISSHIEPHDGNFTLVYALDKLEEEITGRDENFYQLSLSYAEGLIREMKSGQTLIQKVTEIINTERPATYTIDRVAEELSINLRILQRNLADQGTSFREIRETLLRTKSLDLLISKNLSPADIANQLGYSDSSAFHRSFKGWFNTTPRKFKDRHGE